MNDTANSKQTLNPYISPGPHSYLLTVVDDSMTTSNEDSVPDGVYILVDPDLAGDVVSGDAVAAKVNGGEIFRIYIEDDDRKYLKPLNPSYPLITDPFKVLGKMIAVLTPSPRMRRMLLKKEETTS